MKNAARFVVIHECFGAAELLKIKKGLKSFARGAFEVDPDDQTKLATVAKKLSKSLSEVGHTRSANPRNSDVERVPVRGD